MKSSNFVKFVNAILAFNIGVILWGAFVRATGSGAGCGSHWPLCNGEVLPRSPQFETFVEFGHRVTSGIAFLLVAALFVLAQRKYQKGEPVRKAAGLSLLFIIIEALIGAGLVLFEWVAHDVSAGRAIAIVVHLINTFLLLASLSLTSWWAAGGGRLMLRNQKLLIAGLLMGLAGTLLIGASGALTALGDTLFPATSLAEGIRQDFSASANFLIRFRILHPTIAIIVGIYLILLSGYLRMRVKTRGTILWSRVVTLFVIMQLFAGMVNVLLLAPVWMQLVHLLLADTLWIGLIFLTASVLSKQYTTAGKWNNYKIPDIIQADSTH